MIKENLERAIGRIVLDQGPNVIVVTDAAGKIRYINGRFTALTGFTSEDVIGRPLNELVSVEKPGAPLEEVWHRVHAGKEWRGELLAVKRTGENFWEFASITPILGSEGRTILYLKVSEDITERKRLYEEVVKSEAKLRTIFESSGLGMAIVGKEGRILEANDALTKSAGHPLDSLAGLPFVNLFHPDERSNLEQLFTTLMSGREEMFRSELRLPPEDLPDQSWATLTASLARNLEGKPQFALVIVEDVTGRRRMEEELRSARDQAERAVQARSEFLANVSHEIRTPIHAIIGNTELLLETPLNEEQKDYSETVRLSADVLLTLINDVLDFSKIESGKLELESIPFDVCDVVEEAVGLEALQAHKKGLEIITFFPDRLPHLVEGDPLRLRQILVNLMTNAVKFTETGGVSVSVGLVEEEEHTVILRFSVRDTGIGIPDQKKNGLFQAFMQLDSSTTRRFGGTGLGLAICRRLTEMMGGKIDVESAEGWGSTFWFTARFAKQELASQYEAVPEDFFGGHRVLIVDDNSMARSALSEYLGSWGCVTVQAASAREALDLLRQKSGSPEAFRIALIDLRLPDIDGWQLASQVNADPAINATRLILLTPFGLSAEEAKMKLLKWFDGYLTKPVKKAQLLETVFRVANLELELEGVEEEKAAGQVELVAEAGPAPAIRVLVAEDNEVNQQLFAAILKKMGCFMEAARDGKEAVDKALASPFDIIFMDVHMPVMNGLEATRRIREAGMRTPIIAVTASAAAEDQKKCLESGMNDFLSKPFRKQNVSSAMEKWLSPEPVTMEGGAPQDGEAPGGLLQVASREAAAPRLGPPAASGAAADSAHPAAAGVNADSALPSTSPAAADGAPASGAAADSTLPAVSAGASADGAIPAGFEVDAAQDAEPMPEAWVETAHAGVTEDQPIAQRQAGDMLPVVVEVFDYAAAVSAFMGDEKIVGKVLAGYLSKVEATLPRMSAALEEQRLEDLSFEAHGLKGGALNLCAHELAEAAGRLEEAAKMADRPRSEESARALITAFRRLEDYVTVQGYLPAGDVSL